jgi:hypothetical protein
VRQSDQRPDIEDREDQKRPNDKGAVAPGFDRHIRRGGNVYVGIVHLKRLS